MLDKARSYLGQTYIGTNPYDKGQCVGLVNKVIQDVTGLLYPLQGAANAFQLLTCKNTRPDIFEQVKNDPNNPNQLPSVGDIFIYDTTWGNGNGHTGFFETVGAAGFTAVEQNYVANKVTRQNHSWSHIAGWIHIKQGVDIMDTNAGKEMYRTVFHREAESDAAAAQWNGKTTTQALQVNRSTPEWQALDTKVKNYDVLVAQKAALEVALKNEQNKPPKEVIKEVEKIITVETPVDEKAVVEGWFKRIYNSLFNK